MSIHPNLPNVRAIRTIKSFAVRNRTLTGIKEQIYRDGYKQWGLDHQSGPASWDFNKIFDNNNPVILEIGFGNGETLIKNAKGQPNCNYIGVEVFQKGVWNILIALNALKDSKDSSQAILNSMTNPITNLRVCQADVNLVLECITDGSLSGIQIFFPDPWSKSRHHKRRLIQPEFVEKITAKIKQGGFIHLATDWADYANHMKKVMDGNSKLALSLYGLDSLENDNNRLLTKYERRGLSHGHQIVDLKYSVI